MLEINITLNVAENLGKIGKSKQKIQAMEEQDVYCAQFVNLQIFTFVQVEKKTTDLFSLISKYDIIQHIYKRPH